MIYYDKFGIPVTDKMDGGDSAAIAGTLLALDPQSKFSLMIPYFFNPRIETPVRHPDATRWYGRGWRFTRDQMIPLLCAFIELRHKAHGLWPDVFEPSKTLFKMHKSRRFIWAWNRWDNARYDTPEEQARLDPGTVWRPQKAFCDFTGPEIWALWIRLYKCDLPFGTRWLAHLLLHLLDVETLIGTVIWGLRSKAKRVTRNHMLVSIISRDIQPTLVSWLNFELCDFHDLLTRWNDHCEAVGESNTAPYFDRKLRSMGR